VEFFSIPAVYSVIYGILGREPMERTLHTFLSQSVSSQKLNVAATS
jgi:hypothetical protein